MSSDPLPEPKSCLPVGSITPNSQQEQEVKGLASFLSVSCSGSVTSYHLSLKFPQLEAFTEPSTIDCCVEDKKWASQKFSHTSMGTYIESVFSFFSQVSLQFQIVSLSLCQSLKRTLWFQVPAGSTTTTKVSNLPFPRFLRSLSQKLGVPLHCTQLRKSFLWWPLPILKHTLLHSLAHPPPFWPAITQCNHITSHW